MSETSAAVEAALDAFDIRAGADSVWHLVTAANRFVSRAEPWKLPAAEREAVVTVLLDASAAIAAEIEPFLPLAAERIGTALERRDRRLGRKLFRKPG